MASGDEAEVKHESEHKEQVEEKKPEEGDKEEKGEKEEKKEEKKTDEEKKERKRKRKSLWDATADGETPLPPTSAAAAAAAAAANPNLLLAAAAGASSPQQLQQLMQQQELLQAQARAIAQQKVAEATMATMALGASSAVAPQQQTNRIYIGSIYYELNESDILLAFSSFGPISKIDMPRDTASGKHKGFAFIEFVSSDSATAALATMNDFPLGGRRIKVGRPHNIASGAAAAPAITPAVVPALAQTAALQAQAVAAAIAQQKMLPDLLMPSPQSWKIYVGSVMYDILEKDVIAIFQAFGKVKHCNMIPNPETGRHKGYGFIEYETEEAAKAAIQCMNGFELGGRPLKVGWASSSNQSSSMMTSPSLVAAAASLGLPGAIPSLPGVMPGALPGVSFPTDAAGLQQLLSAQAASIQQTPAAVPTFTLPPPPPRPAAAAAPSAMQPSPAPEAAPPAAVGPPSRCILMGNMVGPDEVDDELQNEVTDECGKFGAVEKVVIYQEQQSESAGDDVVKIFVLFGSQSEAVAAQKSLDKRWFGGRQVNCRFYPEERFLNRDFMQ